VNNIGMVFIGGETDIQPDTTKVARNGVVRGNQVYRARSSYGGGFAGGIYVDGGRDIVIERNLVSECDLGIEIGAENPGMLVTGVVVRDNVVWRNDKAGIVFGGFAQSVGRVRDSFFLNNTTWHNDTLGAGFGELWIQFAEDNVVRQNVFHALAGGVLTASEDGNVDNALDWNLWFAAAPGGTFVWQGTAYASLAAFQAGSGQEANGLSADPQLLAPASADFHLRATSPAVNRGDPAFAPGVGETDLDGAPRVSGARVDLGADEATCGNGMTDPGETCDDGDLDDCDGCDSNCTPTAACGNGVTCAPEQCDDRNTVGGDCCGATCALEPAASPCDDGNACTNGDACDGAGTCASTAAPEPVCRGAESGAAVFQLVDRSPDGRDKLTWRWKRGDETLPAALGDPTAATAYTLCAYDASASPQPRLRSVVPPGSRWAEAGSGFRYRDPAASAGGIRTMRLVPGATGSARVIVRGKGAALSLPTLPLTAPVDVQLRTDAGECWAATYSAPSRNDGDGFTGRND
jgi:cysteine-rich repeat protein